MGEVEDLRKELATLQAKRTEKEQIKTLKRQIKAEKFAQTKKGKVVNAIGKFLSKPPAKASKQASKPVRKKKPVSIDEIIARLPQ